MNKNILFATVLLSLLFAPCIRAATINVFLDSGIAPGSSNTSSPFSIGDRDATWDVTASMESGLTNIGAAVMTVRMVTFNVNANSRGAATGGGSGLGILTGANNNWMDANTREGALFQLTFYEDLAKTTELTGMDITFKSLVSRVNLGVTDQQMMDVFSGSGALAITGSNDTAVISLDGVDMISGGEPAAIQVLRGLTPSADVLDFYTISATNGVGDEIFFTEDDSFWVRRRNGTVNNAAYQLGAITFEVVPRPPRTANINIFLDEGTQVPGSSNTNIPFTVLDRDVTWDVSASAENDLANIGAAVMSVRMVTFNINGNSRAAATGGGNGLGVYTGSNNNWMDGTTREAAIFQLSFYKDAAKTLEITGLDITFKSLISRVNIGVSGEQLIDVFAASGVLAVSDTNDTATISVGGTILTAGNDEGIASGGFLRGLKPWDDVLGYYTMADASESVQFTEDDSFWVRRRNDPVDGANQAYQLGGITFRVVAELNSVILAIAPLDTNSVEISWVGDASATYSLQGTESLAIPSWSNLVTNISGVDGGIAVTTTASTVEAFYRVNAE